MGEEVVGLGSSVVGKAPVAPP